MVGGNKVLAPIPAEEGCNKTGSSGEVILILPSINMQLAEYIYTDACDNFKLMIRILDLLSVWATEPSTDTSPENISLFDFFIHAAGDEEGGYIDEQRVLYQNHQNRNISRSNPYNTPMK